MFRNRGDGHIVFPAILLVSNVHCAWAFAYQCVCVCVCLKGFKANSTVIECKHKTRRRGVILRDSLKEAENKKVEEDECKKNIFSGSQDRGKNQK